MNKNKKIDLLNKLSNLKMNILEIKIKINNIFMIF